MATYRSQFTGPQIDEAVGRALEGGTIDETIVKRNILDNGWFTINQRGLATYTTGYSVDRFGVIRGTVNVVSDGITFTWDGTSDNGGVFQKIERNRLAGVSKVYISAIIDGSLIGGYVDVPTGSETYSTGTVNNCWIQLWGLDTNNLQITIRTNTATPKHIRAVKLELGTVSTLLNDIAPNYVEELAKCRRYFYSTLTSRQYNVLGLGLCNTNGRVVVPFRYPTKMRDNPSLTVHDISNIRCRKAGVDLVPTSIVFDTPNNEFTALRILNNSLTADSTYYCICVETEAYLEFSAEL